jgi:quercetin 2,3-dioxygenase
MGPFTLLGAAVGAMEEFFRKMSTLTKPPTPEEAQKIHLAHAMKVVGPPLSL